MIRLILVSGGNSVEHEISLLTLKQVDKAINKDKYDVKSVYLSKDNKFYLIKNKNNKTLNDYKKYPLELIKEKNIVCPKCGKNDFTEIRKFNLLFETYQGVTEDAKNKVYLRGETAQGIFVNFKNVERSMRAKLPFGIAQYGKSFRNEITPGNFIFRTREFEQMELEFFCKPDTDLEWFGFGKIIV